MTILILETDLLWSVRLKNMAVAAGHQVTVVGNPPVGNQVADVAIVNLGAAHWDLQTLVPRLRANGIKVLAHAGHKEKELLELGRALQCDRLATNGELAKKLPEILANLETEEPKTG
jgi:hypothetical protein